MGGHIFKGREGFLLIFPAVGLVALLVLPIVEITGVLLGISVLAPIFVVGELSPKDESETKTKPNAGKYAGWPYVTAFAYWFSTVFFLIELIQLLAGQSQSLNFLQYPALISGVVMFVIASGAFTVPAIMSKEVFHTSSLSKVTKGIAVLVMLYGYSDQAYQVYTDLTTGTITPIPIIAAIGSVCFGVMGWGFVTGKPGIGGQLLLFGFSFGCLVSLFVLNHSSVL